MTSNHIQSSIAGILNSTRNTKDADAVEGVEHWLAHDEYELAFEGLLLELMVLYKLPVIDLMAIEGLALELQMDKTSVLDIDFWAKFKLWLSNNKI